MGGRRGGTRKGGPEGGEAPEEGGVGRYSGGVKVFFRPKFFFDFLEGKRSFLREKVKPWIKAFSPKMVRNKMFRKNAFFTKNGLK